MSKVLRVVGVVAGVVAFAASVAMTFGATAFLGVSLATVAAAASAVSAIAMAGAQALQKPPDMKGTVNEVVIGANMPVPYGMGRTYVGGMKIYDDATGNQEVDNKWRTQIMIGSHGGPIEAFESFLGDYTALPVENTAGGLLSGDINGFYDSFLWINTRKGLRPDTALTPGATEQPNFRGWTANHKLSGMACWAITMEFDEKGKRFASGIPAWGVVAKWVKVYDPRKDSTYPGGSGTHLWHDESTWEWSENAALHALTYARGRFMGPNNVKVVGCGVPKEAIDIAAFVELANVCDANGWKMGGFVYEGPGISKWDNLKRILDAAIAKPVWVGGILTVSMSAPKVALDTITMDDIGDGEIVVPAMLPWKGKFNTIVPRYRSEAHRWDYVQANAVTQSTYVTEDGETKTDERQYDLIQNKDLAAQHAAYDLVNEREFGPISLPCKSRLRAYRPGECLELDLPELGLNNQLAVIVGKTVDPVTGSVMFEFMSETPTKHDYALGQTGVAPPTPSIVPPETVDNTVAEQAGLTEALVSQLIATSAATGMTFNVSSTGVVNISAHTRIYSDKTVAVNAGGPISTGADADDLILVYYDDPLREGGAVTYQVLILDEGVGEIDSAFASANNPYRHFVASKKVPASGTTSGGTAIGSGGGGIIYPQAGSVYQ